MLAHSISAGRSNPTALPRVRANSQHPTAHGATTWSTAAVQVPAMIATTHDARTRIRGGGFRCGRFGGRQSSGRDVAGGRGARCNGSYHPRSVTSHTVPDTYTARHIQMRRQCQSVRTGKGVFPMERIPVLFGEQVRVVTASPWCDQHVTDTTDIDMALELMAAVPDNTGPVGCGTELR